jgi:hypothetical protein
MHMLQLLRGHSRLCLGAVLFLILLLVFFWSQQPQYSSTQELNQAAAEAKLPSYPSAQELSQAAAEPTTKFRVCGSNGEEYLFGG